MWMMMMEYDGDEDQDGLLISCVVMF